jgi:hypothetical protein
MKSPIQSKPVERNSIIAQQKNGVTQSDCCGSGKCCVGACLPWVGCAGVCVPNIGQC